MLGRSAWLCLFLSSIPGCEGKPDSAESGGHETALDDGDADGDGFNQDEDCDDGDAAINPDVEEGCDGIDNDCDGQIDEGVTTRYYDDVDGDGFGDCDHYTDGCTSDDSEVPNCGDCDDADLDVYPDAQEICDGVDDDCDGLTDEDVGLSLYADLDGDGYGDPEAPETACAVSDGLAEDGTDCDDADAGINPGAAEICGDGADQDCDALDPTCTRTTGTLDERGARAEIMGGPGEYAGARVRPAGDMDGDGRDDLWIDLYGWGPSGVDFSGAVMLVSGTVTGVVLASDVASANLYGAAASEYAGWDLSRGDDLDGDGGPDVVIGAYGRDDGGASGAAYVVYGPISGTASLAGADGLIVPEDAGTSLLGYETTSSADLTGDGVGDVVLGSYGSSTDSFRGAAWVVPGPVDGTVSLSSAITITGEDPIDLAGNGLDGVGDVNGDGAPDLVVGAHGDDTAGDAAGKAGVFFGPLDADLSMADADRALLGASADDEFSRNGVNGRGDVNGDGYDDVVIGAMFSSPAGSYSGGAWLFLGDGTTTGTTAASAAEAHVSGEHDNDFIGRTVDIAGDVDGDGYDDLLVAGQGWDGGSTDGGAAGLYYGPVDGERAISDADLLLAGTEASEGLGISAAGAGDCDGDGRADILVGAWFNGDGGASAGAAFLYMGL